MEKQPFDYGQETYGFVIPPEVLEDLKNGGKRRRIIREDEVADLHRTEITNKTYVCIKRLLDIVISLLLIIVLLIPMLLVAAAVKVSSPGKIIFSQNRIGLNGKVFKVFKFRTMRQDTPKYLATSEMRQPDKFITPIGKLLRKSSLDELPQLFNVLLGDMSIIGPRPLIADEIEIHRMRMRFGVYAVRPGITGLAQVNGRDTVSPVRKIHYDTEYISGFSFAEDMRILLSTLPRVYKGAGIVEGEQKKK